MTLIMLCVCVWTCPLAAHLMCDKWIFQAREAAERIKELEASGTALREELNDAQAKCCELDTDKSSLVAKLAELREPNPAESFENWISRTQEKLGLIISWPGLPARYLKRPPFRFLFDIFFEVQRLTGFLGPEVQWELVKFMDPEKFKDKESKVSLLRKVIDAVISKTGPLKVEPEQIVAGEAPERTNTLLQELATAARTVQPVIFHPATGTFEEVEVELTCATPYAVISFTIDSSEPKEAWQRYDQIALGLKWQKMGTTEPDTGRNYEHAKLAKALTRKTIFTQQEWEKFDIKDLREDHHVQSGGSYFKPVQKNKLHLRNEGLLNLPTAKAYASKEGMVDSEVTTCEVALAGTDGVSCVCRGLHDFRYFDIDDDGKITKAEFSFRLLGAGWGHQQILQAFQILDQDNNGIITAAEFASFWKKLQNRNTDALDGKAEPGVKPREHTAAYTRVLSQRATSTR